MIKKSIINLKKLDKDFSNRNPSFFIKELNKKIFKVLDII